jgi:hypothetical protein
MAASIRVGLNKRLNRVQGLDDGIVIVPFRFIVNGTTTPLTTSTKGDMIDRAVTRNSAGKWTLTLRARPGFCFYGHAAPSSTTNADLVGQVDWSTVKTAGTFVVRMLTGSVETDPTTGTIIGGYLLMKRTTRARTG